MRYLTKGFMSSVSFFNMFLFESYEELVASEKERYLIEKGYEDNRTIEYVQDLFVQQIQRHFDSGMIYADEVAGIIFDENNSIRNLDDSTYLQLKVLHGKIMEQYDSRLKTVRAIAKEVGNKTNKKGIIELSDLCNHDATIVRATYEPLRLKLTLDTVEGLVEYDFFLAKDVDEQTLNILDESILKEDTVLYEELFEKGNGLYEYNVLIRAWEIWQKREFSLTITDVVISKI